MQELERGRRKTKEPRTLRDCTEDSELSWEVVLGFRPSLPRDPNGM